MFRKAGGICYPADNTGNREYSQYPHCRLEEGGEVVSILIQTKDRTEEFGIAALPYRKSKCLYRMRGNMIEPLAYFRSDDDAEAFEGILEWIYVLLDSNKEKAIR